MHYEVEQKFVLADPGGMAAKLSVGTGRVGGRPMRASRHLFFRTPRAIFPRPTRPCAFAGSTENRESLTRVRRSTARRKLAKKSNCHCRPARRPRTISPVLFVALRFFVPVGEREQSRRQTFASEMARSRGRGGGWTTCRGWDTSSSWRFRPASKPSMWPAARWPTWLPAWAWLRASAAAIWNCCSEK